MKRIGFIVVVLFTGACASVSTSEMYKRQTDDLHNRLQACINADMTKSDLILQVGLPTTKEIVGAEEIWIYQLSENGATISKTTWERQLFSAPIATTTTTTSSYRASITLLFNDSDVLTRAGFEGQHVALCSRNNRFLTLQAPPKQVRALRD